MQPIDTGATTNRRELSAFKPGSVGLKSKGRLITDTFWIGRMYRFKAESFKNYSVSVASNRKILIPEMFISLS